LQTIIIGIFLILHGLVHLLYAGQSERVFELRPGMIWPDGSWLFSNLPGDEAIRRLAAILLALAALGFITGGLGLFFRQEWWRHTAVGSAVLSAVIFLLLWDGKFQALDEKGWVGILINLVIIVLVFILKRPS
jgi:hypothetical protein